MCFQVRPPDPLFSQENQILFGNSFRRFAGGKSLRINVVDIIPAAETPEVDLMLFPDKGAVFRFPLHSNAGRANRILLPAGNLDELISPRFAGRRQILNRLRGIRGVCFPLIRTQAQHPVCILFSPACHEAPEGVRNLADCFVRRDSRALRRSFSFAFSFSLFDALGQRRFNGLHGILGLARPDLVRMPGQVQGIIHRQETDEQHQSHGHGQHRPAVAQPFPGGAPLLLRFLCPQLADCLLCR